MVAMPNPSTLEESSSQSSPSSTKTFLPSCSKSSNLYFFEPPHSFLSLMHIHSIERYLPKEANIQTIGTKRFTESNIMYTVNGFSYCNGEGWETTQVFPVNIVEPINFFSSGLHTQISSRVCWGGSLRRHSFRPYIQATGCPPPPAAFLLLSDFFFVIAGMISSGTGLQRPIYRNFSRIPAKRRSQGNQSRTLDFHQRHWSQPPHAQIFVDSLVCRLANREGDGSFVTRRAPHFRIEEIQNENSE